MSTSAFNSVFTRARANDIKFEFDEDDPFYKCVAAALEKAGMNATKQQVNNKIRQIVQAAELLSIGEFSSDELKREAQREMNEICRQVKSYADEAVRRCDLAGKKVDYAVDKCKELDEIIEQCEEKASKVAGIENSLHSDLAKDMITLFGVISRIGIDNGANPDVATRCASYATWALATQSPKLPEID